MGKKSRQTGFSVQIPDSRAQISAELLVIMAAVLAVALILVSNLRSTSHKAETKLEARETAVLNKT